MAKIERSVVVKSKFITRKDELTGKIISVIAPNGFQVGLKNNLGTSSDLLVYGVGKFHGGVSGSLTKLVDESSYLVAGNNINITSQSNGSVKISSPGGGDLSGGSFFTSTTDGSIFTTGSAAFIGGISGVDAPSDLGTDISFFVSGAIGDKGLSGVSVFGGDMVVSGGMYINLNSNAGADFRVETDGEDEALFIDASTNTFFINRGASAFLTIIKNTNDEVLAVKSTGLVINENGNSAVDIRIETDNKASAVFVDAGNDKIAFLEASATPTFGNDTTFLVSGSIGSRGSTTDAGTSVFRGDVYTSGSLHISGSSTIAANVPKLSVGCSSTTPPKTALDVTFDYKSYDFTNLLAAGEGGGDRLRIGQYAAGVTVAGRICFYSAGTWRPVDADAVTTLQLLGCALDVAGGADQGLVLLKGFIRVPATSVLNGAGSSADLGDSVFVSTTAGKWDFTAPSAGGDYKRFVGYCLDYDATSGDYLMYFNPDNYTEAL